MRKRRYCRNCNNVVRPFVDREQATVVLVKCPLCGENFSVRRAMPSEAN
jgi:predicted RNA-binding Zn-ribbon protein involved in translation (DUF1610 family)